MPTELVVAACERTRVVIVTTFGPDTRVATAVVSTEAVGETATARYPPTVSSQSWSVIVPRVAPGAVAVCPPVDDAEAREPGFFCLAGPIDEEAGIATGDGAGKPDAYSHLFILA